jgi:hypothetical protein
MKRACRHCDRWHMDYECPLARKSYFEQIASTDFDSHSSSGSSNNSSDSDDSSEVIVLTSYHTTTNGYKRILSTKSIPLDAGKYPVIEALKSDIIGKGIAYLSAQPCPIYATLGKPPSKENPCVSGVVDSGGASIISKCSIPEGFPVQESLLKPSFGGIGTNTTKTLGFVSLPVYIPNSAALLNETPKSFYSGLNFRL